MTFNWNSNKLLQRIQDLRTGVHRGYMHTNGWYISITESMLIYWSQTMPVCLGINPLVPLVTPYNVVTLQWRHNGWDGVSNHQPPDCLLKRLFRRRSKKQSSASLAFMRRIHRWPVNSPHKGPVTRKMFPSDDAIMRNSWFRPWMTTPSHK